jgi:hypothetical protein
LGISRATFVAFVYFSVTREFGQGLMGVMGGRCAVSAEEGGRAVHSRPRGYEGLYGWGRHIGIVLEDSVILAGDSYYSFEESGALRAYGEEEP